MSDEPMREPTVGARSLAEHATGYMENLEAIQADRKEGENIWEQCGRLIRERDEARALIEEVVGVLGDEFFTHTPGPDLREKRYAFWYKACQWRAPGSKREGCDE